MSDDFIDDSISREDANIHINFSEITISGGPEPVSLAVAGRPIESLIFDPDHFPLTVDGVDIDMQIVFKEDSTVMTVARADDKDTFATMDIHDMERYQKSVAFLYMVGVVLNADG